MKNNSNNDADVTGITNGDRHAVYSHSDIWVGIVLTCVGAAAAWMASNFDATSRPYPLTLSLIMAAMGLIIIAKVFLKKGTHVSFILPSKVVACAGLIIVLWILAISNGIGYLLSTFFMQLAFLLFCGVKRLMTAAMAAALISGVSYVIFVVVLEVRLPESLVPWLL